MNDSITQAIIQIMQEGGDKAVVVVAIIYLSKIAQVAVGLILGGRVAVSLVGAVTKAIKSSQGPCSLNYDRTRWALPEGWTDLQWSEEEEESNVKSDI